MRPRRSLIENEVQRILKRCGITEPPPRWSDPLPIVVKNLCFEFFGVNAGSEAHDSIITTNAKSNQPAVIVNVDRPASSWRYSLAHQLCHVRFHGYLQVLESNIKPHEHWHTLEHDPPYVQNVYEAEAAIFAVSLLIPHSLLKNLSRTTSKFSSIEKLADDFNVPVAAFIPAYNAFLKKN